MAEPGVQETQPSVPEEKVLKCEINARDVGNIAYVLLKDKYTFKIHDRRLKEGQDPNKKPLVLHWKNPKTDAWEVKKGLQPMLFKDFGDIGRQVFGAARERLMAQAAAEGDGSSPMSQEIIDTCERLRRISNKLQQAFFKHKVLHVFKGIITAQVKAARKQQQAASTQGKNITYANVLSSSSKQEYPPPPPLPGPPPMPLPPPPPVS